MLITFYLIYKLKINIQDPVLYNYIYNLYKLEYNNFNFLLLKLLFNIIL